MSEKLVLEREYDAFSPLQKKIIEVLWWGPRTRRDLVKEVDKPRTTVYDNLMGLIQSNLVKKYARPTNSRGRPLVFFKLLKGGL